VSPGAAAHAFSQTASPEAARAEMPAKAEWRLFFAIQLMFEWWSPTRCCLSGGYATTHTRACIWVDTQFAAMSALSACHTDKRGCTHSSSIWAAWVATCAAKVWLNAATCTMAASAARTYEDNSRQPCVMVGEQARGPTEFAHLVYEAAELLSQGLAFGLESHTLRRIPQLWPRR
jgi:hypothetical protein